jgi:hypothetical protein
MVVKGRVGRLRRRGGGGCERSGGFWDVRGS